MYVWFYVLVKFCFEIELMFCFIFCKINSCVFELFKDLVYWGDLGYDCF